MTHLLFSPLSIRGLTLRNRIVVPPMHQYAAQDGAATDWHLVNVGKFAAGGAGLVFVESTKVVKSGSGTVGDLGLWDDRFIAPLARIVDFIKAQGAAAGIQLGHAGRKARTSRPWEGGGPLEPPQGKESWDEVEDWELVGPSPIPFGQGWPVPRALETSEIRSLVDAWGKAAHRARQAGFDVVEIHAAHGYLLHEFLSAQSNQRTDEYGGDMRGRMRFLLEVIDTVRSIWPREKPLFVRISAVDGAGWSIEDSVALAREMKERGVDIIDCSSGGLVENPATREKLRYGYQVPFAQEIKRQAHIGTMAVGLIVHGDQAETILANGQADLIGVGREILNNPNWPMDVAHKFGVDAPYSKVAPQFGYWLANRDKRGFGGDPSTWRRGIEAQDIS